MKILINGEERSFDTSDSILQVIYKLGLSNKNGIAIAINDRVVPKSKWETTIPSSGDKILLIKATQGG